jgi:two-component system, OmpR family, response regulator MprA
MSIHRDILLVEDEAAIAELLRRVLVRADYSVRVAADGRQALAALDADRPAAMLLDLILPDMSGFAVLEHMQQHQISVPIIIITANPLHYHSLHHPGIVQVLFKPFRIEELLDAVRSIVGYQRSV